MNLATFRANIANRIGLDNSTTGDQGYIDGWVNDGIVQLLMDTHLYVVPATVTIGSSSPDYTFNDVLLEIIDIYPTSGGVSYAMEQVSIIDLNERRRYAPSTSGPTIYYSLVGSNTLMFFPAPAAGDVFTVYYVPMPTALAASGDDPSTATFGGIPSEFHKAIEYFALSEAADANDDASSQTGMKYLQLYETHVKKIRRTLRRRGGTISQRAIIGPRGPRRRGLQHDNSVY